MTSKGLQLEYDEQLGASLPQGRTKNKEPEINEDIPKSDKNFILDDW